MDYKAFVSSIYIDLKDHRAHVIRELRSAGFFVDPMEAWTSSANEPKTFSRETKPIIDLPQKLVLLGDPGSGKSTLANWIAWQLASNHDEGRSVWTDRLGKLVPFPTQANRWPTRTDDALAVVCFQNHVIAGS